MDVVFFCLYCEAWSCRCSCMGSVSVSSCRSCMFVSCVHPVAVLNAAFCMTCVCWWALRSERKRTLCLPQIVSSLLSCSWQRSVGSVVVCSHVVY